MYKIKQYLYAIISGAMIVLSMPLQVKADLINIQFSQDILSINYTGGAQIGGGSDFWNQATAVSGTINPLLYSNSISSGAQVKFAGDTVNLLTKTATGFTGGAYENLMRGYIATYYSSDAPLFNSMTFTGLKGNTQYDLYVYTQGDYNGNQLNLSVTGGTGPDINATTNSTQITAGQFILNQNYVDIKVQTSSAGGFVLNYAGLPVGTQLGVINGIQLYTPGATAPEPPTVALIGFGGLLLFAIRLRKSPLVI